MNKNTLQIFQIDAFTSEIFKGNPACVMPLDNWLPDELLLKIAKENNVSETAFFIKKDDHFYLRWFTPEIEMDLCGHATLATAYCLKKHMNFNTTISGIFKVKKVISRFVNGSFTQTLEATRDMGTNFKKAKNTLLKFTDEFTELKKRAKKDKATAQDAYADRMKGEG